MIISRSPLRISIGGGGTDLPSYYKENEGFVISAAINKYIYISISRPFNEGIYLKYSKLENVKRVEEIEHPIFREALKMMNLNSPQIEITSIDLSKMKRLDAQKRILDIFKEDFKDKLHALEIVIK